MSFSFEGLFQELEKAKIQWLPLGSLMTRSRGMAVTASKMRELHREDGAIKVFAGGKTTAFLSREDVPEKDIVFAPSIIVKSRGDIAFEFCDKPFSHKSELWSYQAKDGRVHCKFFYYYLKTQEHYFRYLGRRMQMPQLSIADTENFLVPLLPLGLQLKLSEILDRFMALLLALKTEQALRAKAYKHYLNTLLSDQALEKHGFTRRPLRELAELKRGQRLTKSQLQKGGPFPVYQNSLSPLGYHDLANVKGNTCFIISAGAAGELGFERHDFWAGDDVTYLNPKGEVLGNYLYYYLLSKQHELKQQTRRGSVPRISRADIGKTLISFPSLKAQEKITQTLDKFHEIAHSKDLGLPRAIHLREQEFLYYRDKLMNFKRPKGS